MAIAGTDATGTTTPGPGIDPLPSPPGADEPGPQKHSVRWLAPFQLLRTAREVSKAQNFAKLSDKREVEAAYPQQYYDFSTATGDEFWFDYVADVGDGFNATYNVARHLGQESLTLPPSRTELTVALGDAPGPMTKDGDRVLPRGRFLVMGGDETYPVASEANYRERTLGPYEGALPPEMANTGESGPPFVFALPGNHDWYDELSQFVKVFCQSWRFDKAAQVSTDDEMKIDCAHPDLGSGWDQVGGWRTRQSRSYFALKLPHQWWLLALDSQFDRDLDVAQKVYFKRIADQMGPDDKIIIAAATPSWRWPKKFTDLGWFLDEILRDKGDVKMFVAGDTHHFVHFQGDRRQFVTSGGGGAYLAATHKLPETIEVERQKGAGIPLHSGQAAQETETATRQARFPSKQESMGVALNFWRIPFINHGLITLLALVQFAFALVLPGGPIFRHDHPASWILTIVVGAAMVASAWAFSWFKQEVPPARRLFGGFVHAVVQLALGLASLVLLWPGNTEFTREWPGFIGRGGSPAWIGWVIAWLALVVLALLWGLVSAYVVSLYLFVASWLDVNTNELFAAISSQDYKSFLRIRVTADRLVVIPIGMTRSPRSWTAKGPQESGQTWTPAVRVAADSEPHLIGHPIVIAGSRAAADTARSDLLNERGEEE